jgi:hypothetical protein
MITTIVTHIERVNMIRSRDLSRRQVCMFNRITVSTDDLTMPLFVYALTHTIEYDDDDCINISTDLGSDLVRKPY